MEFDIPFLNPAWLGIALVSSLVVSSLLPARLRQAWIVVAAGLLTSSALALVGALPWLGVLHASAYAACMVTAFVIGYLVTLPRARLIGMHEQSQLTIFMIALVGGIIGARLGEVWEQWPHFAEGDHHERLSTGALLLKMADIDSGGMVWYGGVVVASILIVVYIRRQRLPLLQLADLILPSTILALGIGRVGCFLNGCCYGRPTDLPWAVSGAGGAHIHPTQLYETGACLVLAGASVWWWYRRTSQGQVTLIVLIGYAAWRTFNEALRGDTVTMSFWGLFPATTSQVVSIDLALATAVGTAVVLWRRRQSPEAQRLARQVPGSSAADPVEGGSTQRPVETGGA